MIKHKAASNKVVANFKPSRVSDRPYVSRPEGLMPYSQFEGSVSVTLHPTYPNLLRPSILNIGLSRFPSIRGLSAFVLGILPARSSVTLEGSLPYASTHVLCALDELRGQSPCESLVWNSRPPSLHAWCQHMLFHLPKSLS